MHDKYSSQFIINTFADFPKVYAKKPGLNDIPEVLHQEIYNISSSAFLIIKKI